MVPLLQLMVSLSGTHPGEVRLAQSSARAAACTPLTTMMKTVLRDMSARLLVQFATSIDRVVERYDLGFFYQPHTTRPWLHFEVFRDENSWTAWVGKFELVWDRPRLEGAQQ